MNSETKSIARNLENTLTGQPWYGRSVFKILEEVDESKVNYKPNSTEHSLLELLWHMNTWAEFTLGSLENRSPDKMKNIEDNDWREIDPRIHDWKSGIEKFRSIHQRINELLNQKENDSFLGSIVPGRQYKFRFLLNGLIQHNIYHLGQIAYLKKMHDRM